MKNHQLIVLLWVVAVLGSCTGSSKKSFRPVYAALDKGNYFEARNIYLTDTSAYSPALKLFTEAVLLNAFNKPGLSGQRIDRALKEYELPDSLMLTLYKTKFDNAVKLYNYPEARDAAEAILESFSEYLDEEQVSDYKNSLKLWGALAHVPPMQVHIGGGSIIRMEKDRAGLNTLTVSSGPDSLNFIFDTGANLSTTTESVARRLNMDIIPVGIEVGTITGVKTQAHLGVCRELRMGNITWRDVVFLVMPDETLAFPQIDYQITGILGFPVIESLNEIRITKDGLFIVPEEETLYTDLSNLAMEGLTPLIYIDGKHYTFDTGADKTMLYQAFYEKHRTEIEAAYEPTQVSFGGAGGKITCDAYEIDYSFTFGDESVILENIACLTEKIRERETVYGNIGQDLIRQFDVLIMNFNRMFIVLD